MHTFSKIIFLKTNVVIFVWSGYFSLISENDIDFLSNIVIIYVSGAGEKLENTLEAFHQ